MNESKITVRYAKALFLLALEKGSIDTVRTDMTLIGQALNEHLQFSSFLKSPVVRPSQKVNFVREAFEKNIDQLTLNFMLLLIQNKREGHLEGIIRRFFDEYRRYKGIKAAVITTAVVMDDKLKEKFLALLSSVYKSGIELQSIHDPSIIGGFVLKVGDQQFDASVATGLKKMKNALLTETLK